MKGVSSLSIIPVVGIDVSKRFSELAILSPDNTIYARLNFKHNSDSFNKALDLIKKAEEEFKVKPAIVMEATGHYNKILFNFFNQSGYSVIVVNPIQTDSIKNLNIRKVKNDKIDAYRIALLYGFSELKQTIMPSEDITMLRSLCRQYHRLVEERSRYKYRLLGIMDQIMLNYSDTFRDIYCDTSLSLLEKYPSPDAILNADRQEVIKFLASSAKKKSLSWSVKKYELLCEKAAEFKDISIANPSNIAMQQNYIMIIKTFNSSILYLRKCIENFILQNLKSTNPTTSKQVYLLTSIPGIGVITAATIIGEIGNLSAFKNHTKLTAFFGVDPSVYQSGQFKGTQSKISKRGSSLLRKALYIVVISNISCRIDRTPKNPYLYEYYKQKCISKPKKVAMVAVMHKLILYIFAVLRDQVPFVPRNPEEHAKLYNGKNAETNNVSA